jgi:hypothetical protein
MLSLQMSDERHRHPYSSGEFLLGRIQEAPSFTNQFTEPVCPRLCRRVLSIIFGRNPRMPPLLFDREFLLLA